MDATRRRAGRKQPRRRPLTDSLLQQYNVGGMSTGGKILLMVSSGSSEAGRSVRNGYASMCSVHTGVANLAIVTGFGPSMKPMFNPGALASGITGRESH